jgi:hypothetical protein
MPNVQMVMVVRAKKRSRGVVIARAFYSIHRETGPMHTASIRNEERGLRGVIQTGCVTGMRSLLLFSRFTAAGDRSIL